MNKTQKLKNQIISAQTIQEKNQALINYHFFKNKDKKRKGRN